MMIDWTSTIENKMSKSQTNKFLKRNIKDNRATNRSFDKLRHEVIFVV